MAHLRRRILAGIGALAVSGVTVLAAGSSASADSTTPGWEPDPNAIGSITLYDSSGSPITSGNLSDVPFAAYAVATHAGRSGDDHAQLYAYTPQEGGANPQTWSGDELGASAYNPVPNGTPAAVSASGNPFVTGTDLSMDDYIGEYPNNLTDSGYADLYELRIFTAGPSQQPDTSQYDRLDISVDSGAGTWQVVYPGSAPTLNGSVTISGKVRVGSTVTCNASFTDATSTSYAWSVNSAAISGATKSTFMIPAKDYKKSLTCTATGMNGGGSTPGTSSASKVGLGAALHATKKPTISGKPAVGKTVKVSHGTWSPAAKSYAYQWELNGKKIKKATKDKLKISKSEKGKKLSCKVTAILTGYADGATTTKSVKVKK
ncbi:MAG TPA: hypothetical protein VMH41_07270 [Mycobacteriales bacterium]|nr:hypothetical protein [Mycobacteriales bacterium]